MNETELAIIKSDYFSALADYGIEHQAAIEQTENHSDLIKDKIKDVSVKESEINGKGLFSEKDFKSSDLICIARKEEKRTLAGRYANHSPDPNGAFLFQNLNIILMAIKDIKRGEEITVDYRHSINLQMQLPKNINQLVVDNKDISVLTTGRVYLTRVDAAAYDLLLNEDHIDNLTVRERVLAFEAVLLKLPQVEIPVTHEFIKGLYRREITFKKGTFATGKIHKEDHMDVVLSGEMLVVSDGGYKHIKGPCFLTSIAGKKKAGYALTDCVWCSYHPTKCTTIEDVEKELFINEFDINLEPVEV
jgi:hypothetical protein